MQKHTRYQKIKSYITKDFSEIRELMHPNSHDCHAQSLAEAIVPPHSNTILHMHLASEELYHITSGSGLMILGDQTIKVFAGDTVCIPPKTPHKLQNTEAVPLKVLCCCAPAYNHEDTELLE